jgi:hypothetical protein
MGMDLLPKMRTTKIPPLHYTFRGWATLIGHLEQWGVDVSEFSGLNDGDPIKRETCLLVADALEQHFIELSPEKKVWLKGHAETWRSLALAGGCLQH